MMRTLLAAAAISAIAVPVSCQQQPPRLVVVITVDQMIPDYVDRFGSQLTGGIARLTRQGLYYPNGLQDHAVTETAPGHSTILSGRSPASTAVVANNLGVADPSTTLVGTRGYGASPARFRGTTLADWMLAADPGLQVLSVSRKDRGAILPIGRMVAPVFWYNSATGSFTTSTWYGPELPEWLTAWNARGGAWRLAGHSWTLLLPESGYPEEDAPAWERRGTSNRFPYQLPTDSAALFSALQSVPWMDSLTMDVALEGVRQMRMGTRPRPDLLAVSLSTTDAVGHTWGPESREIHDQIVRLDRWLGWFLDSLETSVGRGQLLVALTADHGVQPYPESAAARGLPAGRIPMAPVIARLDSALSFRFQTDFHFDDDSGLLFGDIAELRARGVDVDSLAEAVAREVGGWQGVRRVLTPRALAAAAADDGEAGLWRRLIPHDFQWLVAASLEPHFIWGSPTSTGTTHGTTNLADLRVPIAFMGAGIPARRSDRAARTVDIGPTLAALLGIRPLEPVEGVILPEVTTRRP